MSRSFTRLKQFDLSFVNDEYQIIAGVDEVGRGALAGPVVASCVVLPKDFDHFKINDSKILSKKKREELSSLIIENAIAYAFGEVPAKIIDEINILEATKLAMKMAIEKIQLPIDLVLVDAINKLDVKNNIKGIIKGDAKSLAIASASILAKVYRDNLMDNLAKEYPQYHFDSNKGYGTKEHLEAINKFGPIEGIHRFTFKGVSFIPLF